MGNLEAEIMRKIILLIILFIVSDLFAQESYKANTICEFKNKREQGFLFSRKWSEISEAEDDITGNGIKIDENGNIYFINSDMHIIYLFEEESKQLRFIKDINFLETGCEGISKITDKYYFCTGTWGRFKLLDKEFNFKFKIKMLDWGMRLDTGESYYDEATNILFFRDSKQNIHSIVHPGMNEEENRKNYKNPDETLEMIRSGKDTKNLGLYKDKYLTVNGQVYYWIGTTINKINYQIFQNREVDIWNDNDLEIDCTSQDEDIESIAIHPSGDIYILRMNWQTNTHNLYYVENTWDPQWRKEWYENHETENVSQTVPSTNVAVNKEMTCSDNLRLRSEEATTSRVITTMQKGTKVKILKLGKAETIDGITSNWVQVEVLSGSKDKDGKALKAGIIGWCYGGYLE